MNKESEQYKQRPDDDMDERAVEAWVGEQQGEKCRRNTNRLRSTKPETIIRRSRSMKTPKRLRPRQSDSLRGDSAVGPSAWRAPSCGVCVRPNGRICVRTRRSRRLKRGNEQWGTIQESRREMGKKHSRFSPVCVRTCVVRWSLRENARMQMRH
jgi:hypothetical protein